MLNDRDYELISKPIIELYSEIERELIVNIAKRFQITDKIGGTLEWQLKKLDELGGLNADNLKTIAKYSGKSKKELLKAIKFAGLESIDLETLNEAYDNKLIKVDPVDIYKSKAILSVIDNTYIDLENTFKLIQTTALESSKKEYINILNQAHLEVSSGIYDYQTSIRRSLTKMADKGIKGATYERNGGTIVNYSLEGTVRRDILTAVNQTANKVSLAAVEELGAEYVEVSAHLGSRPSHAEWQGQIYKVNGKDEEYDNLYEKTGYGTIEGLGGVNCRHHMYPFFLGISTPTSLKIDPEENERLYDLTKQQRLMERDIRNSKKRLSAYDASSDKDAFTKESVKLKTKENKLNKFLKENNLSRDRFREQVSGYNKSIAQKAVHANKENVAKSGIDIKEEKEYNNRQLSNEEIVLKFKNYENIDELHGRKIGAHSVLLDKIMKENNTDTLGGLLNVQEYESNKDKFIKVYRGVSEEKYKQSFETENFIGGGALGNGIYTTTVTERAQNYSKINVSPIEITIDKKAKLATMKDIDEIIKQLKGKVPDTMLRNYGLLVTLKGYDGLVLGNETHLITNKRKLKVIK